MARWRASGGGRQPAEMWRDWARPRRWTSSTVDGYLLNSSSSRAYSGTVSSWEARLYAATAGLKVRFLLQVVAKRHGAHRAAYF